MQIMNRLTLAAAAAVALAGPTDVRAQGSPAPFALMARHDSLIGGRGALEQRESIRIVGTLSIPMASIEAPFEILKKKPNSYYFRSSLGPMGEMHQGFDGKTAWAIAPGSPPMILEGAMRDQIVTQADFFADLHDTTQFSRMQTVGVTEFEGKKVHEVRITRKNGTEIVEYFDVTTGLSAGGLTTADTPMGKVQQTSIYSDYKDFDGFKWASRIVQRNPQYEVILSIQLIEFNKVDSAAVALPESVKPLVKP